MHSSSHSPRARTEHAGLGTRLYAPCWATTGSDATCCNSLSLASRTRFGQSTHTSHPSTELHGRKSLPDLQKGTHAAHPKGTPHTARGAETSKGAHGLLRRQYTIPGRYARSNALVALAPSHARTGVLTRLTNFIHTFPFFPPPTWYSHIILLFSQRGGYPMGISRISL